MTLTLIITLITIILMIAAILFLPKLKIGKLQLDTYPIVTLIGAIALICSGCIELDSVVRGLTTDTAINPIKILVLFISMTVLSIFLDELGFFAYLASITLAKAKNSQFKLFVYLYLTISILTIFTSNDIIILTFTPFICYFAKNANINPIPYLVEEFVAANTFSLVFVIGNPTNIYIATSCGITFFEYFSVMIFPSLAAGIGVFFILLLAFRRHLRKEIIKDNQINNISSKPLVCIGVGLLAICTIMLAVSSYLRIAMWLVSLCFALALIIVVVIIQIFTHVGGKEILGTLKRTPWQLIPFVISMFVIVLSLDSVGVTKQIATFLGDSGVFGYGITSFVVANFVNNIPMSVFFAEIIKQSQMLSYHGAVYASIIGSNIGAYFTPVGALAGIMWSSIISRSGVKFGFVDFIRNCAPIAITALAIALLVLKIVV